MRLICGLGNPGDQYKDTLHNAGFMAVDQFAEHLGLTGWKSAHQGLLLKGSLKGNPFLLLKPQTFMNLSGRSLVHCAGFYKVDPTDILVVSDDLDLEVGRLRFREKGGHGGHNGLRNIIELSGSKEFNRIKMGIGRPVHTGKVTNHVLGKPSVDQKIALDNACEKVSQYIEDFVLGNTIQIESTP